jgi:GT2 family glycosyltransferase
MKNITSKIVPVVIPYFNAPEALSSTIKRVEALIGVKTKLFIRDNTVDNILFTRAVNEGLRKFTFSSEYDYILVLNHDALLHPESLKQMIAAMNADLRIGICAPVALSKDKSVNWAGSTHAFPWGRHMTCNLTELPPHPFETYWVNGACMLLRSEMIREIGLLDENMKFICSDSDYSFTARARGWKCVVVQDAFIDHEPHGSADMVTPWLNKIKLEDQLFFAKKWVSADLYRHLSYEGKNLNHDFIQTEIRNTQLILDQLNANAHADQNE